MFSSRTYPLFPDKFNISDSVKKPMSVIDANYGDPMSS